MYMKGFAGLVSLVLGVAALAAALSCLVRYVPFLHAHISSGFSIILCTVCAAMAFAWLAPVKETEVPA